MVKGHDNFRLLPLSLLLPFFIFPITDDRKGSTGQQMEFKSNQWFGATVRSSGDHILVSMSRGHIKIWIYRTK